MNSWLDESLVGLLLTASLLYAFATLGPRSIRRRMLALLAALLARAPTTLLHSAAQRLEGAAAEKTQGACGGCDNCGSEKATGRTEIRVPIGNLRARRSQQK
jgi:hypothetical protein